MRVPSEIAGVMRCAMRAGASFLIRVVLGLVGATTLLCACASDSGLPVSHEPPPSFAPTRTIGSSAPFVIGVLVAGWHSGLILPVRELGPLSALSPRDRRYRYLSFGWGNRRFYMARHPSVMEAIRALFSSPSAVFIEGARSASALVPAGGVYRWLCADGRQVLRIDAYLHDALRWRGGKPMVLRAEPQLDGAFYLSRERYDAFRTCNTWTATALKYAGLPVHAGGVIFSSQLLGQIRGLRSCRVVPTHG